MIAAARAGKRSFQWGKKKQGEVRLKIVADGGMHGEDAGAAQPTTCSLIGLGRVGVAVAEDDGAGIQRGLNNFGDGLGAVGKHECHLGERADGAKRGFGA